MNAFKALRIALVIVCAHTLTFRSQAQPPCPPPTDTIPPNKPEYQPNCMERWFQKQLDAARRATSSEAQRKYLRRVYPLRPGYPLLLEQYLAVADERDLLIIGDQLIRELNDSEGLSPKRRVQRQLALVDVFYYLGAYSKAYEYLRGTVGEDYCLLDDPRVEARVLNNLGVLNLLHGSAYDMQGKDPFIPVRRPDLIWSAGYFVAALSLDSSLVTTIANRDKLPADSIQECTVRCPPALGTADNVSAKSKEDSALVSRYCSPTSPSLGYDSLLRYLKGFDEILFLFDLSKSMDTVTSNMGGVRRIDIANEMLRRLTCDLRDHDLGLLSVEGYCACPPEHALPVGAYNLQVLDSIRQGLTPHGLTPLYDRYSRTSGLFSLDPASSKVAFLITDGMDCCSKALDLCEESVKLYEKSIYTSVLHLLPQEEIYGPILDIYHCMVRASSATVYRVENGEPVRELRADDNIASYELPLIEPRSAFKGGTERFEGGIRPSNGRWRRAHRVRTMDDVNGFDPNGQSTRRRLRFCLRCLTFFREGRPITPQPGPLGVAQRPSR